MTKNFKIPSMLSLNEDCLNFETPVTRISEQSFTLSKQFFTKELFKLMKKYNLDDIVLLFKLEHYFPKANFQDGASLFHHPVYYTTLDVLVDKKIVQNFSVAQDISSITETFTQYFDDDRTLKISQWIFDSHISILNKDDNSVLFSLNFSDCKRLLKLAYTENYSIILKEILEQDLKKNITPIKQLASFKI